MDLAIIVYWLSLTFIAGIFLNARKRTGLALVTGALLLASPLLLLLAPLAAPWLVLGLWVALVLFPNWLSLAAAAQGRRQNYPAAWLLARSAAILHPMDDLPDLATLYRAFWLEKRGRWEAAGLLLRSLAKRDTLVGLNAQVYLSGSRLEFAALLRDPRLWRTDPAFMFLRLWVLGESGRLADMIDTFLNDRARRPASVRALHAMCVMAFCGRPAKVAALHHAGLRGAPAERRRVWVATAQLASGGRDADVGRATLADLMRSQDPVLRRLAERRLIEPPPIAAERLGPVHVDLLDHLEASLDATLEPARRRPRVYATLLLFALNLAAFAAEIYAGGSENDDVLYQLGALYVPDVIERAALWRLVSALFLHAGPIHLTTNMLGLLLLGSFIEPMLGRARFILLYLGAGVGSNVAIVLLSQSGVIRSDLLVGASGAIMGLVGAVGAAALRQWLTARSFAALGRVLRVGVALGLQTAIDLTTPRVSVAAHLCGASAGFILASVLRFRWAIPENGPAFDKAAADPNGAAVMSPRRLLLYAIAGGSLGASLLIAAHR